MIEKVLIPNKPYISFVVVSRNDNYGGNLLYRMQASINALSTLCEKHCLNMELIIVEWNPPKDNPHLANVLTWPESLKHYQVRIIEVPEEIHQQLPNPDRIPLFVYRGINVGVRRAHGDYILVTNPDILFSEELIEFLCSGSLLPGCFYRTARYDVRSPIPLNIPVEKQLRYCEQHTFRINSYRRSYDYKFSCKFNPYGLARALTRYLGWRLLVFPFVSPYGNASGDFLIMHRKHWHSLRGYPEVIGVHHIDSLMVCIVVFQGLKQIRLRNPLVIYHPEHSRPEDGKPYSPEVKSALLQLLKTHKPIIFNDETWGLGKETLSERLI